MINLLNKSALKEAVLNASKEFHGEQFSRVSADVYPYFNEILHNEIVKFVKTHEKDGKTLKAPPIVPA